MSIYPALPIQEFFREHDVIKWAIAGNSIFIQYKENGVEEEEEYICELCGKVCKTGSGLASHMKTHQKEEVIQNV